MDRDNQHYYLVGMPGIGKSHYLEQLRHITGMTCIDLDLSITDKYQLTIPQIINRKGIEIFRLYEAITLRETHNQDNNSILACGGGTPCFHDNMEWINRNGISIYLHGTPAYLKHNYRQYNLNRPLLGKGDLEEYIDNLYINRIEYYKQAHHTIDVGSDPLNVANNISDLIDQHKSVS